MTSWNTWRRSARRATAVAVSGALGLGGLTALAAAGPPTGAAVAPGVGTAQRLEAAGTVTEGSLEWGLRTSYRNYIAGPIAHGEIVASDGAVWQDGSGNARGPFTFPEATGTIDPDTGAGELAFAGQVYTWGHDYGSGPILELTLSDVRLQLDGADSRLVVDAEYRPFVGADPNVEPPPVETADDLVFADVDLSGADLTPDENGVVTVAGAPATGVADAMTAIGWDLFYSGEMPDVALDPVSFTATLAPAGVAPAVTAQPADVTVTEGEDAVFTAAASGDPGPAVHWESSADEGEWSPVDGAGSATLTVPAVTLEQDGTRYRAVFGNGVGTAAVSDAATLTVTADEPAWEPVVELFAADGTTPLDGPVAPGDEIVVRGSGIDPAANPATGRPPIPAGVPAGTYVVFGRFADTWQPSAGAPSSARTVIDQRWALSQASLDQVPAQYQDAIRAQWAELTPDGSFETRLTVAENAEVEGNYGVYTYAAGGAAPNAAQELAAPVAVEDDDPPGPISGTLDWGVKASFRNYITGPIAHGGIEVREPATTNDDGTFGFAEGTGTGDASAAELSFAGEVYFHGHEMQPGNPLLELTLTEPRITVSGDTGTLVADVVSKSLASGEPVTYDDVELASLDFAAAPVTVADGVISASSVPATLTGDGVPAFAEFYPEGTALDPVSFTAPLTDEPGPVEPVVMLSEATDLDPYADAITVRGSGFAPDDLAGGLRVGIGGTTGDGTVPSLNPEVEAELDADGTFVATLVTGAVEPGATMAVHTAPVDPSADAGYATQTPITFAEARTPALVVTPTEDLEVGQTLDITGSGFAPNRAISVAITANTTTDATYAWPTGWLGHEVVQADAAGNLHRTLTLADSATGTEGDGADCAQVQCYVASFSSAQAADADPVDYRADRSQDVFVSVTFVAGDSGPDPEPATLTVDPSTVTQGESVTFHGANLEPGTTATVTIDGGPGEPDPEGEGVLDWGVKASFRQYVEGPIANGSISVTEPANRNDDGTFRFADGAGTAGEGMAELGFAGGADFEGHGGLLQLTLTEPRVSVDGDSGVLVADVVSKSLDSGEAVEYDDVELADLDLSASPMVVEDGVASAQGVPATLTETGAPAFAGFYQAGTALDPVSFEVVLDGGTDAADRAPTALPTGAGAGADVGAAQAVVVGDQVVDETGTAELRWTVPDDFEAGPHSATLVAGAASVSADFTVEAVGPDPDPGPDPKAEVSVEPGTVERGDDLTITASGYQAGEDVEVTIAADLAAASYSYDNGNGQSLTVGSADENPVVERDGRLVVVDGGSLAVSLEGLANSEANTADAPAGFYLMTAVDNGEGEVATPAIGGVDMTGGSHTSRWITNYPYAGSEDVVVPIAADDTAETDAQVVAADEFADCEAAPDGCVLYLRVDHRAAANRDFDVRIPLEFVTAAEAAGLAWAETLSLPGTVGDDGSVTLDWQVPDGYALGESTVTVTGAASGRSASDTFLVEDGAAGDETGSDDGTGDAVAGVDGSGDAGGAGDGKGLPDTGAGDGWLATLAALLVAGGAGVTLFARRRQGVPVD